MAGSPYNLFANSPSNSASNSQGAKRPLSVTQVNQKARQLLEREMARIVVVGEVSNFKVVSGHCYFALKDSSSNLPAALFRREASRIKFDIHNGLEVVVTGKLTLYVPYGRYQIIVDSIEPKGVGALQLAFEQLKEKLHKEGLFDDSKKRSLPFLPRRVGVVTSQTGAVIRDIIHVATRRFPNAQILLIPTKVQGAASAPTIVAGINKASALAEALGLDALIVGRGGGSMEDLWGYNDEAVARAIANCSIPVVSAVGHETDFTIADFVADVRAPTPSAAAEILFPVRSDLARQISGILGRTTQVIRRIVVGERRRVEMIRRILGDGRPLIREYTQRFTYLQERIRSGAADHVVQRRLRLTALESRLARLHPRVGLHETRLRLEGLDKRNRVLINQRIIKEKQVVAGLAARLNALSPLGVLERGYGIVLDSQGQAIVDSQSVTVGETLDIRVAKGKIRAKVLPSD